MLKLSDKPSVLAAAMFAILGVQNAAFAQPEMEASDYIAKNLSLLVTAAPPAIAPSTPSKATHWLSKWAPTTSSPIWC